MLTASEIREIAESKSDEQRVAGYYEESEISSSDYVKRSRRSVLIGRRLRSWRSFNQMTAGYVADYLQCTMSHVQAMERGVHTVTDKNLALLADLYGTTVEWLLMPDKVFKIGEGKEVLAA